MSSEPMFCMSGHECKVVVFVCEDVETEIIFAAHRACGIPIMETGSFQEHHANGQIHDNCLVLAIFGPCL